MLFFGIMIIMSEKIWERTHEAVQLVKHGNAVYLRIFRLLRLRGIPHRIPAIETIFGWLVNNDEAQGIWTLMSVRVDLFD